MSRGNFPVYSFNGGQVSPLALGRIDLPRLAVCGETVRNWLLSTLGWMGLRPGTDYLGTTRNNLAARLIPFVGTAAQCSLLELTDRTIRIWNDGALVMRSAVDTTIANGSFAGLTGWTAGAVSGGSVTASGSGTARIAGNGISRSTLTQAITVPPASAGAEHGLTIVVPYGPVLMRIGTSAGDDDLVTETSLGTGSHKLAVTLTGTVYLQFAAPDIYRREVGPVSFDAVGVVELPAPWAAADIRKVRLSQQGDVLFAACRGYPQQRIESRGRRSWSVADYRSIKGPFLTQPANPATIRPSGKTGGITLTASRALFKPGHVGAIWELIHTGQDVAATVSGDDQWTDPIRVSGARGVAADDNSKGNGQRTFKVLFNNAGFVGTIRIQRAFGNPEGWFNYSIAGNAVTTVTNGAEITDTNDNAIVYYRIGVAAGEYTSGSATVELQYPNGSTVGVVRVTGYTDNAHVGAEVVSPLGDTVATSNWREGIWSAFRGFPRDVAFQDGRLWWLGSNYLYGSVSDAFDNYDDGTTGDAAPVIRSIATGPADGNLWILRLFNLVVGSAVALNVIRSSAIDEPITPTAFSAREFEQVGGAEVAPVAIGPRGVYVGRSGVDLFEIALGDNGDYAAQTLMRMVPDIAEAGIVKIFVQRRPDQRIHAVLADGTMLVATYNRDEKVIAFALYQTDGAIEDGEALPGTTQDDVYLCVLRTLNGTPTRCIERQSSESDTRGGAVNRLADCGRLVVNPSPAATISGADAFNGRGIVAWADGKGYQDLAVAGGNFTLPVAATTVWYGLPYTATFLSTKLAYAADAGTALLQKKRIDHLGLLLGNTARAGLRFGPALDRLDPLPLMVRGREVDPAAVEGEIDDAAVSFDGSWSTDSRFALEAQAPWPCTVKAAVIGVATHDSR